jgi:hypothetical protein
MKKFITGLLKDRRTRWGFLAVVLAAAGLTLAWDNHRHYRLGGGFIGRPVDSGGMHWSAFQAPLDPAGKTAALRVGVYSYSGNAAGLLALSGADALSDGIGQVAMITGDTAKGSLVFYGLKQGTLGSPLQVKQIWIFDGLLKFTSRDTYDVVGEMLVYAAETDQDGDGRPDPGAALLVPPIPALYAVTRVLP